MTFNEVDGCKAQIYDLIKLGSKRVFAVDAGSHDGTIELLNGLGIEVLNQDEPGYNNAIRKGLEHCSSEYLVFFHPKGTIDVSVIKKINEELVNGFDVVIASRNIKGGTNEEDNRLIKPRKWFVLFMSLLIRKMFKSKFNSKITDVLHGCRGLRMNSFEKFQLTDRKSTADLETIIFALSNSLKIIEIPAHEKVRASGKTHFPAIRTGTELIIYTLSAYINMYSRT